MIALAEWIAAALFVAVFAVAVIGYLLMGICHLWESATAKRRIKAHRQMVAEKIATMPESLRKWYLKRREEEGRYPYLYRH